MGEAVDPLTALLLVLIVVVLLTSIVWRQHWYVAYEPTISGALGALTAVIIILILLRALHLL